MPVCIVHLNSETDKCPIKLFVEALSFFAIIVDCVLWKIQHYTQYKFSKLAMVTKIMLSMYVIMTI